MSSYDAPQPRLTDPFLEDALPRPSLIDLVRGLTARGLFLALAVPIGLFLVFAIPPFQGLDEPNHFFRAYTISGGALVAPMVDGHAGAVLPACVDDYADVLYWTATQQGRLHPSSFLQEPAGCASRPAAFVSFDNTANYSPIAYLPQTIGVAIARFLGGTVPEMFYMGRLFALIAFTSLVALALTVAPRGRPVLLAVGLMPMSLILGTQFSADGMTIALSLLLVAAVIRCRWHPDATWRSFLLAAVAAGGLALCKSTYFVLVPLLLLAPTRLFPSRWTALAARVGALGVITALVGVWYLQVRGISFADTAPPGYVIDPLLQLRWIVHDKQSFVRFVLTTLFGPQTSYFTWMGYVSWVGFSRSVAAGSPAPPPLLMAAGIAMVAVAYVREAPRILDLSPATLVRSAMPVALVAVNAILIVTALFLTVVPVGYTTLWLQGRYLLPLTAAPVITLLALQGVGGGEARKTSLMPLLPFFAILLGYLLVKVPEYFYS
jgi:Predicted membrane protein (DUF2142)